MLPKLIKPKLVILLGPTGVGKTQLSIDLARYFKAPILSCDSRQMYRELKIGTAVPTPEQLTAVPHYFIGNLSVHDYYNVSEYEVQALKELETIFKTQPVAFLVGGSGLYIDVLVNGIDDLPTVDPDIREKLTNRFKTEGIESLQNELLTVDPEYYHQVDLQNGKRILKALEVYYMTGKPYSSFRVKANKERFFDVIWIGLNRDRAELYERIDQRVDQMIADGLVDEARLFFNTII